MKLKTLLSALVIGAGLTASSLFALPNTVKVFATPFNGGLSGGEIKAITSNNGTLLTWCVEKSVRISRNTLYTYTIDNNVLNGSLNLGHPGDIGAGDPISKGTAWLYTEFVQGLLKDSLNTSNSYWDANHNYNAGEVQKAIWMLEDETPVTGTNYYYNYVQTLFGGNAKNAEVGHTVKALNIWGPEHLDKQSMLIYVPDGGITSVLLGLGLLSLALIRRKQ
jgi:hypothetical protein